MAPWTFRVALLAITLAACVQRPAPPKELSFTLPKQPHAAPQDTGPDAGDATPETVWDRRLSPTRQLRRIHLALLGTQPTVEQYQQLLDAPDDTARQVLLDAAVDAALLSNQFYTQMVAFGHDYLKVGSYNRGGANENYWVGDQSADLGRCPAGTAHAGDWGVFSSYPEMGDHPDYCDNQDGDGNTFNPPRRMVEPWWAPGTMIPVLGRAGAGNRTGYNNRDCGHINTSLRNSSFDDDRDHPECSCGPNLIYCRPVEGSWSDHINNHAEDSQRRQAFEEPARLFAHLAWHDRPLSDLVLGNYSVGPMYLQQMYVRMGRQNSANAALDDVRWWDPATWQGPQDPLHTAQDPLAWREFVVEKRNPNLLALTANSAPGGGLDRTYTFDPRSNAGEPLGVGAAGVLTSMGALSSFARERVRGARWLETFACRQFAPPPSSVQFNPYRRDPATEGVCQHCHVTIDPASIHFKRWEFMGYANTPLMPGVGPWKWAPGAYGEPWDRFTQAFAYDTKLTPVTQAQITANPNARFIDFLPPDQQLFGQVSDGTIGPLGFGKLLVRSGEFDLCMVQKLFERFVGRRLDPSIEQEVIQAFATRFVEDDRQLRAFVRFLMTTDHFKRGL